MKQSSSSSKRGPSFKISDFVEHVQIGQGQSEEESIVREIRSFTKTSDKFGLVRHVSEFQFVELQNYADPFQALEKHVNDCVYKAVEEGKKKFGEVHRIGFEVVSKNLDWNLTIPISPLTKNSVDAFLNRFEIIEVICLLFL